MVGLPLLAISQLASLSPLVSVLLKFERAFLLTPLIQNISRSHDAIAPVFVQKRVMSAKQIGDEQKAQGKDFRDLGKWLANSGSTILGNKEWILLKPKKFESQ